MGAYVSRSECQSHYNVTLDCSFNLTDGGREIGGYGPGEIAPDADVAGLGIVAMFLVVTCFALAMSIIDLLWRFAKTVGWKAREPKSATARQIRRRCGGISLSTLLESLVVSCSDQQIFTGGAYAITLRYWKGCSITAYHYNMVANMMLLTCATHLMSITINKKFWEYPWLAWLRVVIVLGVYLVTGLLLSNQNADHRIPFPTSIPGKNETDSLLFMHAACFQGGSGLLASALESSFQTVEGAERAFIRSEPGNRVEGWNMWLILLLWYGAAIIVDTIRYLRRGLSHNGTRSAFVHWLSSMAPGFVDTSSKIGKRIVNGLYGIYLLGGVAISGVSVGFSANYMLRLREWAGNSGWLEVDEYGQNEEEDATSFGQLVPVFLGLLTLFTFAQNISEMTTPKQRKPKQDSDDDPEYGQLPLDSPATDGRSRKASVQQYQMSLNNLSPPTSQAHFSPGIGIQNQTGSINGSLASQQQSPVASTRPRPNQRDTGETFGTLSPLLGNWQDNESAAEGSVATPSMVHRDRSYFQLTRQQSQATTAGAASETQDRTPISPINMVDTPRP